MELTRAERDIRADFAAFAGRAAIRASAGGALKLDRSLSAGARDGEGDRPPNGGLRRHSQPAIMPLPSSDGADGRAQGPSLAVDGAGIRSFHGHWHALGATRCICLAPECTHCLFTVLCFDWYLAVKE